MTEDGTPQSGAESIITIADVCRMTTLAKSTIYAMVRDGRFPSPVRLSARRTGWRLSAVNRWAKERDVR